jgi:hypothetical protein
VPSLQSGHCRFPQSRLANHELGKLNLLAEWLGDEGERSWDVRNMTLDTMINALGMPGG